MSDVIGVFYAFALSRIVPTSQNMAPKLFEYFCWLEFHPHMFLPMPKLIG